jgi:hypothetical protein
MSAALALKVLENMERLGRKVPVILTPAHRSCEHEYGSIMACGDPYLTFGGKQSVKAPVYICPKCDELVGIKATA